MFLSPPHLALVASRPDDIALAVQTASDTPEARWTWRELHHEVLLRAAALRASGLQAGEHVGLALPPSAEWVFTFHALLWIGVVPLLFPPDLAPDELQDRTVRGSIRRLITQRPQTNDDEAPDVPAAATSWELERPLFRVWTSGTTGAPKTQTVRVHQVVFSALGAAARLGVQRGDRWLLALPTHHVGGASVVLRSAIFGFGVELHPSFDAAHASAALSSGRIQLASFVPIMLERILDVRSDAPFPASVRALMLGGAPTSSALQARASAIGAPVAQTWGMSETGSHIATSEPGSAGGPLPVIPFVSVETNADGRLVVRGPITRDGTLLTNDRGEVTDGLVHVAGRADRVIISGGENIDLAHIEQIYAAHDALQRVAAVGVADEKWGERPHIYYEAARPLDARALEGYGAERLERFATPDSFTYVDELPRNPTGKIDYPALQALSSRNVRTAMQTEEE